MKQLTIALILLTEPFIFPSLQGQNSNLLTSTPYPDSSPTPTSTQDTQKRLPPLEFVPLDGELQIIEKAQREILLRSQQQTSPAVLTLRADAPSTPTQGKTATATVQQAPKSKASVTTSTAEQDERNLMMLKKDVLAPATPPASSAAPGESNLFPTALFNPADSVPTPTQAVEVPLSPPSTTTPSTTSTVQDNSDSSTILHVLGIAPAGPRVTPTLSTGSRLKIVTRQNPIPTSTAPTPIAKTESAPAAMPSIETSAPKLDPLPPSLLSEPEPAKSQPALAVDLSPSKPQPKPHPTVSPSPVVSAEQPDIESNSDKKAPPSLVQIDPVAMQATFTRSKFDPQIITNQSLVERAFSRVTDAESQAAEEWVMQTLVPVQKEQVFTSRQ